MSEARIFIEGLLPDETNLVLNGDLSQGNISGWTVLDFPAGSFVDIYTTISRAFIHYDANGLIYANIRVSQTANIQNGNTYNGRIDIINSAGIPRVRAVIGANTSDWFTDVGTHEFEIVADGTSFYLEFENAVTSPSTFEFGVMDLGFVALYSASEENEVDLNEFGLELQYGIDNITDISKITSTFSLDFELPNTNRNAKIFKYYYELDVTDSYNPNKGLKAYLEVNSRELYRGTLKINSVVTAEDGNVIGYNAQFNGALYSILSAWGETKLDELDYSEFNHDLLLANTVESWVNNIIVNGVPGVQPMGTGYIYPLIDNGNVNWGSNLKLAIFNPSIPLEKVYPGIYAWQYWQKIFNFAGATYESDFIDSDFFKRLVIPFNGKEILLTQEQIDERKYQASVSASYNQSIDQAQVQAESELVEFGHYDNDSTGGNFDNSGGFNTSTFQWTAPNSGTYNFKADLVMRWRMTINDALPANATAGFFSTTQATHARLQLRKQITGGDALLYESDPIEIDRYTSQLSLGVTEGPDFTLNLNAENIKLLAGETVFMHVKYVVEQDADTAVLYDSNGAAYPIFSLYYWRQDLSPAATDVPTEYNLGDLEMKFVSGTWSNDVVNIGILEGDPIDMNAAAVKDLPIRDFFSSICKMFFLTVVPDVDNPKHFYIKPYVDYITNDVVDWDQKRDVSKQQIAEPLGELDFKKFVFKYADDEDYYNKHYKENWSNNGYNFASRAVTIDNDFLTGEGVTELVFAPTIVVDEHPGKVILPAIFDSDRKQMQTRPRILHFSGTASGEVITLIGNTTVINVANAPVFGMFNDKYAPTQSIEFGFSGTSYYWNNPTKTVNLEITNNNLFNKYYSKYVQDITDPESRKVTDWFYLTEQDIYELDFSKLHYFSGYYFRLLKVYYNPLFDGSFKVELLKVKDNPAFDPSTIGVGGGTWVGDTVGIGVGVEVTPGRGTDVFVGDSIFPTGSEPGKSNSTDNYISQAAINCDIIGGEENSIYESENVYLTNCYNVTVESGVDNVVAINCEDLLITEPGTYISGIMIGPLSSAIRVTIPCPGSNPTGEFIRKTCLEMFELMSEAISPAGCGLQIGKYYWITDVGDGDGTNDAGVIVQAIARDKVSKYGHMIALNADYQNIGTYVFSGVFTGDNLGIWTDAITPVLIGDVVIWNNYHWRNLTGINTSDSPDIDTTNWVQVDKHTDNGYIKEVDAILWDMDLCYIIKRSCRRGNEINFDPNGSATYEMCQFGSDLFRGNKNSLGYYDCANQLGEVSFNVAHAGFIRLTNLFNGTITGNTLISNGTIDSFYASNRLIETCTIGRVIYPDFLAGNMSDLFVTDESSDAIVVVDCATALSANVLTLPPEAHIAGKIVLSSANATETINQIIATGTYFPDCIAVSGIWFEAENGLTVTFNVVAVGAAATHDILHTAGNPLPIVGRTNGADQALIMRNDNFNKVVIYNSWN